MPYYKSDERAIGEAAGGLIGLLTRFLIWCLVYSSFVSAFGAVLYYTQKHFSIHWFISVFLGIASAIILFFVIGFIEAIKNELKKSRKIIWVLFKLINILLISGIPSILGGTLLLGMFDLTTIALFEKIIIGAVGGLLLAIPAYIGVMNILAVESPRQTDGEKHISPPGYENTSNTYHKKINE